MLCFGFQDLQILFTTLNYITPAKLSLDYFKNMKEKSINNLRRLIQGSKQLVNNKTKEKIKKQNENE